MHRIPFHSRLVLFIVTAASACVPGHARPSAFDPGQWPRAYQAGDSEVILYMPQVEEWKEFRQVKARAAIGLKLDRASATTFGTATLEAETATDFEERSVRIGARTFSDFRFPELDAKQAARAEAIVRGVIQPETPVEIPLDAMTASVERGDTITDEAALGQDPPPIFYSSTAAVLVNFIGEPRLEPVEEKDPGLMFAVNTNWDVLFDGKAYYLLAGDQWLASPDLMRGPWTAATALPDSFRELPDDGNWSEVKSRLYLLQDGPEAPRVFLSDRPSELILLRGKPQLAPITGTSLLYVVNTDSDLFYEGSTKSYYFLTAGRWFAAEKPEGPWRPAPDPLPDDFRRIPPNHPKAAVLASVKGTPEADQAVILASIPRTATVTRATAKLVVDYEGDPVFKPVTGSEGVLCAINTARDVFLVSGGYYCCYQGVWFQAPAALGVWTVCDKVPAAIYTIPPQSPKYNVTYVHVYHSTPETVQVGATAGYSGAYIARGMVVFGVGLWLGHELADDDHLHRGHHYYPSPCWYGYGCGAVYHPVNGYYRRGAAYYGPYGGAGYGAAYNPATGTFTRGAYAYGPYGAVKSGAAYNPWTDTGYRRTQGVNAYGSWGSSVVVRDDDWIRTGHHSNDRRTIAGVETSRGGAAMGINRERGEDLLVAKNSDGDVYVGRDGKIYKKDENGWQVREGGGWNNAPEIPDIEPYTGREAERKQTAAAENRKKETPGANQPTEVKRPENARPAEPSKRPETTKLPETPGQQPAQRRPGYTNQQPPPEQLNRDAYSRRRAETEDRSTNRPTRPARPERRERN